MSDGWVKIHRKMLEWEWWDEPNTFRLFVVMLLKANHKKTKWRGNDILPGQLLSGRKQLSEWSGLSERQVRTSLNNLISTSEVTSSKHPKYTIFTIVCWNDYQETTSKVTAKRPASDQQDDQQATTSKNVNNTKNVKNDKEVLLLFEEFWSLYPRRRRGGKANSEKAYRKALSENRATEQDILEGLKNYARSDEGQGKYAKGCAAWLNDDRWTDQPTLGTGTGGQGGKRYAGNQTPPSRAAAHRAAIDNMEVQQGFRQGGSGGYEMPGSGTD